MLLIAITGINVNCKGLGAACCINFYESRYGGKILRKKNQKIFLNRLAYNPYLVPSRFYIHLT